MWDDVVCGNSYLYSSHTELYPLLISDARVIRNMVIAMMMILLSGINAIDNTRSKSQMILLSGINAIDNTRSKGQK